MFTFLYLSYLDGLFIIHQQMEREVNVFWPELIPSIAVRGELLPRCLLRLAVCLDILAETVSKCQEKVYFRPAR